MTKTNLAFLAIVLAISMLLSLPSGVLANGEEEEICAEAEERYKELYGEEAGKEDAVIVKMYKYTFCPPKLTIKAGTKVRWVNVDKRTSHSVWLKEAGVEESERFFPEETWEHEFTKAGEYPYLCGPHGDSEGMTGTLTVVE